MYKLYLGLILGYLFGIYITPYFDGIGTLFQNWIALRSTITQSDINRITQEVQPVETHSIGFEVPDEIEYIDEDDFEDYEEYKIQNKIGFK